MRRGGKSDPRNKSLMKMFNLIDIGEHAGSGVPNIFNVWEDEGWEEPTIKESLDPDPLSEMEDIEAFGANRIRTYRLRRK